MQIVRSIYGCIEAALLWYDLYKTTLEKLGFKVNLYDKYVMNAEINGKQCTLTFYVDDNKISHVDINVIEDIIKKIAEYFGDLKIFRGKTHTFLGMNISMLPNNVIEVEMKDQIRETIEALGEDLTYNAVTQASKNLFSIDEESDLLDDDRKELFHSITAKLLYLEKRARPDIETAVAFLTSRVQEPRIDDWNKLKRTLSYLQGTIDMTRKIGCNKINAMFTWVDAADAVWNNMRSQTGGYISLGQGMIHARSSKQKLNTKSSTESELVGMSDYLPYNLWLTNFLQEKRYNLKTNVVYRDNQSVIKMEKMVETCVQVTQDTYT